MPWCRILFACVLLSTAVAEAVPIGEPHPGGEVVLQSILDDVTGGAVDAIADQLLMETFTGIGTVSFELIAEHTFLVDHSQLGIYSVADPSLRLLIFDGPDSAGATATVSFGAGSVSYDGASGPMVLEGFGSEFGFFLNDVIFVNTFFSQAGMNGGDVHQLAYALDASQPGVVGANLLQGSDFLLAWEDLPLASPETDFDYQDMVLRVRNLVPALADEPSAIALIGIGLSLIGGMRRRRSMRDAS